MKFLFVANQTLPPLAWCLNLVRSATTAEVMHGVGVDCKAEFFFEGCWSGAQDTDGVLNASVCAASGVAIRGKSLIAFCPTNTLARLHVIKHQNQLWISNSMAFAVAASNKAIRPDYHFYQEDLSSIIHGLAKAVGTVPLQDGAFLKLFYHCNINIDSLLSVTRLPKIPCQSFSTFSQYRKFLVANLGSLLTNAQSASRLTAFEPITSISRGYDSATCAVLAKEVGCQEAITFFDNESDEPDADNGTELASALGLTVTALPRTAYKTMQNESEFLALGTGGEDAFFSPMEKLLKNRVFISGFHGDKVWDKNLKKISDQIIRGDPSGADLEEFRLRVGFIHVAIPFFGCQAPAAIHNISNAREMAPWSIDSDYDRPICRRIAEEAGLPREGFGRKKRVMSRSFTGGHKLAWYMGASSLKEFQLFAAANPSNPPLHLRLMHALSKLAVEFAISAGRVSYRLQNWATRVFSPLERHAQPYDSTRKMFHWAFQKKLAQYVQALRSHPSK